MEDHIQLSPLWKGAGRDGTKGSLGQQISLGRKDQGAWWWKEAVSLKGGGALQRGPQPMPPHSQAPQMGRQVGPKPTVHAVLPLALSGGSKATPTPQTPGP